MKRKILTFISLSILIISLTGCNNNNNNNLNNENIPINIDNTDYESLVLNSTVNINTDTGDFGAGFIYNDNYIITNYHVVYNAKDIKVVTYNKDEYNASLVGFNNDADIAVLKIDKQLESITLGNSDEIKEGDTITAIGNPDGDLSFSKAKGKVLNVSEELLDIIDKQRNFIWYDGNAISGYSGGPVYDKNGKVIGVLNARYAGDLSKYNIDNLCRIIPINSVKVIIKNIIEKTN